MCGLVGIAGDIDYKHKKMFEDMLVVDALRGTHGTGVASVGYGTDVDWLKKAGDVFSLMNHKTFDRVVTATKKVLMGHNRHATLGAHNADNAHPFDFKRVIGAHNGTIPLSARKNIKDAYQFDTDSEGLYSEINDHVTDGASPEEAVRQVLEKLDDGAWALTMWFKKERELCFIRNKERPLFYCLLEEGKVLAWASESWMLYAMASRNGCKIDGDGHVKFLSEDTFTTFKLPVSGQKFEAPTRASIKGAEKKLWSNVSNFPHGATKTGTSTTVRDAFTRHHGPPASTLPTKFPNDNKNGHYKPPYKDHRGNVITKLEFSALIKAGDTCCYCNSHTPVYGEEVLFLRPSPVGSPQFFCKTCCHDDQIMEIGRAMR